MWGGPIGGSSEERESRMILPPRISPGPRNQDEYDMCCGKGETHQDAPGASSTCGTWGTARQKGRMRMKVASGGGSSGRLERKEEGQGASDGRRDVLIPRESGGGPVHVPCPMRGSQFPDAGLPSGRLLCIFCIRMASKLILKHNNGRAVEACKIMFQISEAS